MNNYPAKLISCALCLFVLAVVGCPKPDVQQNPPAQSARQPEAKQHVTNEPASDPDASMGPVDSATFVFAADFKGFQRPCGCAAAQHGGLLRLGSIMQLAGTALKDQTTEGLTDYDVSLPDGLTADHPLWLVDCGNYADANRRLPGLRVKGHLAALKQAGAKAAVVNYGELRLSEDQAQEGFSDAPLPLACCNVSSNIPGISFEKSVQFAANWYLIGLAANAQKGLGEGQGGWWEFHDPLQSVTEVLATLSADANVVIAAVHQPVSVVNELAKLNVRAVITDGSAASVESSTDAAPRIPVEASRATKLQLLSFDAGFAEGYKPWFIVSGEEWPDNPEVAAVLRDAQADLKEQLAIVLAKQYGEGGYDNISWGMDNKYLPPAESSKPTGQHYLGATACMDCHSSEHEVWEQSAHAAAWESLVEANEQETLDCLQCHTTGMFERGGYTPFAHNNSLVAVGCESCHGPGYEHAKWADAGADGDADMVIERGSADDCLACHDSYNSPSFVAESYWDVIAH